MNDITPLEEALLEALRACNALQDKQLPIRISQEMISVRHQIQDVSDQVSQCSKMLDNKGKVVYK